MEGTYLRYPVGNKKSPRLVVRVGPNNPLLFLLRNQRFEYGIDEFDKFFNEQPQGVVEGVITTFHMIAHTNAYYDDRWWAIRAALQAEARRRGMDLGKVIERHVRLAFR